MEIQVVSFHCILKNKLGRVLSSTVNYEVLTSDPSSPAASLKGLSDGLKNLRPGEKRRIFLPAEEAYGFYDQNKVIEKSLDDLHFEEPLRVGEQIALESGQGAKALYRVVQIHSQTVILDGNHPLAGQDLIFEIEAFKVREATPEEISQSLPEPAAQIFH